MIAAERLDTNQIRKLKMHIASCVAADTAAGRCKALTGAMG